MILLSACIFGCIRCRIVRGWLSMCHAAAPNTHKHKHKLYQKHNAVWLTHIHIYLFNFFSFNLGHIRFSLLGVDLFFGSNVRPTLGLAFCALGQQLGTAFVFLCPSGQSH